MMILSWNYRGLDKSSTVLKCQKKAHEFKSNVMFLMETKLMKDKGKDIWVKCGFLERWEVPREGYSGGLILSSIPKQSLK